MQKLVHAFLVVRSWGVKLLFGSMHFERPYLFRLFSRKLMRGGSYCRFHNHPALPFMIKAKEVLRETSVIPAIMDLIKLTRMKLVLDRAHLGFKYMLRPI